MRSFLQVALICALAVTLAACVQAQDEGPVAVWDFNDDLRGLMRDTASDTHHAVASQDTVQVDSPGGKAAVFDGLNTYYRAKGHPDLVMSDQVTVDVWLMLDDIDRPEPA